MPEKKEEKKAMMPQEKGSKIKELLEESQISLLLDTYDDIFSDFDPRPYDHRALSDDFLLEARKASRDKEEGTIELIFMMPAGKRDANKENLIKKRLREHFKKHHARMQNEAKNIEKRGLYFILVGVSIMFIATFILFKYHEEGLFKSFMVVLLEPAGWFLFWEGLNQAIFEKRKKSPDIDFYHKMSKADVRFESY